MKRLSIVLALVFGVIVLTSCAPGKLFGPTLTLLPTFTPTLTSTPTVTSSPTRTPTSLPSPTPTRPAIPAPVVPDVSATISVDNVSQLTRLTSLGEGDLLNMQLSPNGKWVVFSTFNGVLVLDSTTLKRVLFLPTSIKPYFVSFIDNGAKLTARDCFQGYVWTIPDGKVVSHVNFLWFNPTYRYIPQFECTSFPDPNWEYAFGSSNSDSMAGLYRLSDGEIQYTLNYKVINLSISPDNKLVALNTGEKLVVIQYQDGKVITEIPEAGIKSLFFYQDGKTLGAIFDNQLKFWDTANYQLIDTVISYGTKSIVFSPDNSVFAIRSDNSIRLLRADDRHLIVAINGVSITFTSDSQGLAVDSVADQFSYYTLNLDRSQIEKKFTLPGMTLHRYYGGDIFSADNSKLLIIYSEIAHHWLEVIDVSTGSILQKFDYTAGSAVWLPSLQTIGVEGWSNFGIGQNVTNFDVLDLKTGSITNIINNDSYTLVNTVKFSSSNDLLISVMGTKVISWELKNNGYWQLPINPNDLSNSWSGTKIGFSPDGKTISISDTLSATHFISSVDYSTINTLPYNKYFYLSNGSYGWTNGFEVFIDSKEGNHINRFGKSISDLDFNVAQNLLATVSTEGLKVWELSNQYTTAKLLFSDKLTYDNLYLGTVSFSPDGNYVAATRSFNNNTDVAIWNTIDGKLIYELGGGYNVAFAFSADSKMIGISTNSPWGNRVTIFDLSTGNSIFSTEYQLCEGGPPKLSFSPDGKYLALLPDLGYPSIWGIP